MGKKKKIVKADQEGSRQEKSCSGVLPLFQLPQLPPALPFPESKGRDAGESWDERLCWVQLIYISI